MTIRPPSDHAEMTTTTTRQSRYRDAICPSWCVGHDGRYNPWETYTDSSVRRNHIGITAEVVSPLEPLGCGSLLGIEVGQEEDLGRRDERRNRPALDRR